MGRILDGAEIARLVEAMEKAGRKKAAKQAAKTQRAQTSCPAKTKTSRRPKTSCKSMTPRKKAMTTKPHRGEQKAAASPTDISSDSSDYYDIENESGEDIPPSGTPAPSPHLLRATSGTSATPSTPCSPRQRPSMSGPSTVSLRGSLRFRS